MRAFTNKQHVKVISVAQGATINALGTVERINTNGSAWIALDRRRNDATHPFPADDPHGRGTHVKAYPEDCELAQTNRKERIKAKRAAAQPVPTPATFGRDHWTTLLYIETCCTDSGEVDKRRMRCDSERHPHLGSTLHTAMTVVGKKYPTRLRGDVLLGGHDDWDCAEDLVAAGYMESVGTVANPEFRMTDAGNLMVMRLRVWKQRGGSTAEFTVDEAKAAG